MGGGWGGGSGDSSSLSHYYPHPKPTACSKVNYRDIFFKAGVLIA